LQKPCPKRTRTQKCFFYHTPTGRAILAEQIIEIFVAEPHSAKSIFAPNSLLHSTHSWGLSLQQLGRTPFKSQSNVCLLAGKTQNNGRLWRLFGLPDSVN